MNEPTKLSYDPPEQMTALEKTVIERLCGEPLNLEVLARSYTGVGLYTWFIPEQCETKIVPNISLFISADEAPYGLGVVAYKRTEVNAFKDGPAGLEFHSYGEAWWGGHTSFAIQEQPTQEILPK